MVGFDGAKKPSKRASLGIGLLRRAKQAKENLKYSGLGVEEGERKAEGLVHNEEKEVRRLGSKLGTSFRLPLYTTLSPSAVHLVRS